MTEEDCRHIGRNTCMKCGAQIIDFSPECEGDGKNGWKLMKGTWGKKHERNI